MSKIAYKNLQVYQLAEQLAQVVWGCARGWDAFARDTIGKQLVRAADSVGANIAEGYGRGNGPDQKRCLRIARGSLYEAKYFLRLAYGRGLVKEDAAEQIKAILSDLPPKLNAYLRAVGRDRKSTVHNPQSTIEADHV